MPAAGIDEYEKAFRYFKDSRERKPERYDVLKRCSLMTCINEPVFAVAAEGLQQYSFKDLERVLVSYPAEAGWYQLNSMIRKGAWAAWWLDPQEIAAEDGLPARMAETAERVAAHLSGTDGDTALVERLRLLVLAGRHHEAGREFDKWYPAFENVADFAVCRRLAEAVAPDDLLRFAEHALPWDLLERRTRAERRLEMSRGLHEFFEQTRHYVSRRDVEGILESAVHGTEPPPPGIIQDGIPPGPPRVIHMHAHGGMGKSTQLAWLVARYGIQQEPPVLSAVLDAQSMVTERLLALPELLLIKAADQFLKQAQVLTPGYRHHELDRLLGKYGHRSRELDREFDAPGSTPLQRWNPDPLPKSVLTEFADTLHTIARAPVLLCLDTTDELLQAPEDELAPLLRMLHDLVHQVDRMRVVLSGRSDVTERAVFRECFSDVPWRSLGLKPFTAKEAGTYLRLRGIDREQAARIVAACEQDIEGSPAFTPLVLALLAGSPDELPSAGDSLYLFVVDRELDHIKDKYTRNALKYCAVARHPTYDYFVKVLVPLLSVGGTGLTGALAEEPEDPKELWDRLIGYARRSAWIKGQDTRLDVHVNVRRELRRRMRSDEESAWRQFHRDAAGRCGELARQAGSAEESAGWVAEQVYHELHSAVDRHSDHEEFLNGVAETWHRQVALAWRRGDFAGVIDLADRLLSADLESAENAENEGEGLGEPDPRVMSPQLWYDIALERAYGELHAVLYGGRPGWFDVDRYLKLTRRRAEMTSPGRPPVRQDRLRADVVQAALWLHDGLREGLDPVREANALLSDVLQTYQTDESPSEHHLRDLWVADAQLLLASCRVRIGRTQERADVGHAEADRAFVEMFDAAVSHAPPQARLMSRYAMQDWELADRPDLVRAWQRRLEAISAPTDDWTQLAAAAAQLGSGLPLQDDWYARSGFSREALRADLLTARSHLLVGEPHLAERLLQQVTLPAVSGQMEPELAFETLMILARAEAQMLELEQADTYAHMAMGRASDDERRLAVMALGAATALSSAGDLGRADQWIARARPLREESRGAAGTAMFGAECALLHRWGRLGDAEELLRRWADELCFRRKDTGRHGSPPTAAEWLSFGLHALVCGPVGDVKKHLAAINTALESIPGTNRRLMLLAEQARLYATIPDAAVLTDKPRIDAVEQLLARQRSVPGEHAPAAGLRALWAAEVRTLLLGGGPRTVAEMRTAAQRLGRDNGRLHLTWLRLHRLLPPDAELVPEPLPLAKAHDQAQRLVLRAADLLARAHHDARRRRRRAAEEAAGLLGSLATDDTTVPTAWHLLAARDGADVGMPADALAELLHTPLLEEARRRNLQFALRRLGRYEGGLPTGKADESWRRAWAAYQREARGGVPAHLRQAVRAAAEERPVTQVVVDVQGNAVGTAPRPDSSPTVDPSPSGGALVWRATEDFLLSPTPLGVAGDRPVDVILLHGEMRPYDQGAALRLPGSARSIRPEDVDRAVRTLCDERRQPPPLVVLDVLPQEAADGSESQLRDLFAFQLHLLGYVPAVLASGPVAVDPDDTWRRTALSQAVRFGRTAHQIAERLQQFAARHGDEARFGPRIRLLTHIPEEETFGIGLL
ncbi:hypothetical protein F7R91_20010 [Streptomyces luteolifulvus]|uniref:Uncharacterized protein n=1 Tax=Streptomyces luteolifulvus TaxID=2615112 RepID=A0A6H9UZP5_9ACTN|nr:hypothetical protein [Streptomyces luteolifulvus]KAB1144964.1 hypothetical protein F7R91_20010 [Streptomyces luteolifulvus]